jgi:hypothetical protein
MAIGIMAGFPSSVNPFGLDIDVGPALLYGAVATVVSRHQIKFQVYSHARVTVGYLNFLFETIAVQERAKIDLLGKQHIAIRRIDPEWLTVVDNQKLQWFVSEFCQSASV